MEDERSTAVATTTTRLDHHQVGWPLPPPPPGWSLSALCHWLLGEFKCECNVMYACHMSTEPYTAPTERGPCHRLVMSTPPACGCGRHVLASGYCWRSRALFGRLRTPGLAEKLLLALVATSSSRADGCGVVALTCGALFACRLRSRRLCSTGLPSVLARGSIFRGLRGHAVEVHMLLCSVPCLLYMAGCNKGRCKMLVVVPFWPLAACETRWLKSRCDAGMCSPQPRLPRAPLHTLHRSLLLSLTLHLQ